MMSTSNRGVSDVVAFTLTFSIIILSVGAVYTLGLGSVADLRDTEQVNSADRTMQGVAETISDVTQKNAPGRSIAIGLDEGALRTRDSKVTVEVTGDSGTISNQTIDTNALVIAPKESLTKLVYENGLNYRAREGAGVTVQRTPTITCTDNVAILELVKLRGQISTSVPGSLELEINRNRRLSTLRFPDFSAGQRAQDATNVTINVSETRRPDAWDQHFGTVPNWNGSSGSYTCSGVDAVFVQVTVIDLDTIS